MYAGFARPQTTHAFPRRRIEASTILISAFGGGAGGAGGDGRSMSSSSGSIENTAPAALIRAGHNLFFESFPLSGGVPWDPGFPPPPSPPRVRHEPGPDVEVADLHLPSMSDN